MTSDPSPVRVFLVGCPRSGTTLLQAMLGAHPDVAVFPETHFFDRMFGPGILSRVLGRAPAAGRRSLAEIAAKLGAEHVAARAGRTIGSNVRAFLAVLDTTAIGRGRRIWVEKTPGHLPFTREIERRVPGSRFLHLIRNGADVIASLRDVTLRHPEVWGGERGVEECVDRWVRDIRTSLRTIGRRGHRIVRYERLVARPAPTLERVAGFLGMPYDSRMVTDYATIAGEVAEREPWKESTAGPIRTPAGEKFRRILTPGEQEYVTRRLREERLTARELDARLETPERRT